MSREINIELNVQTVGPADTRHEVSRLCIVYACSYTKDGGAPTITDDCTGLEELEHEAGRLKAEIDAAVGGARSHYEGTTGGTERESKGASAEPATPGSSAPRIDSGLAVSEAMTREVRTVNHNDSLSVADELMKVGRFRHVVVLDDSGEVTGVISRRDIFHGALAWSLGQGAAAHQKMLESYPVKQVMESNVVVIAPAADLGEAARLMLENKVGCVPVVDGGELVGILTEGDFLALLTGAS